MSRKPLVILLACCMCASAPAYELSHKLTAPDAGRADQDFGESVALAGNLALVGNYQSDGNTLDSGAVYLYDTSSGALLHKFIASDGALGDLFGYSVALSGNTALVGSLLDDDNGLDTGSAYLFDTTTGNFLQKLTAPDGNDQDEFGRAVALAGNLALVASTTSDFSGSAYLFDTISGSLLHKFTAPDVASGDSFGWSVALAGDTALIGAIGDRVNGIRTGAAYLFDTNTGNLLHKLSAPDGELSDRFGWSVALTGDLALIGSRTDEDSGTDSGSAYLFDTATGALLHKLIAPDGAEDDQFGHSVALSGDTALIGSHMDDDNGLESGSAYLFDTNTGSFLQKLIAPDVIAGDGFGRSVALAGDTALVGSPRGDGNVMDSGAAYLFRIPEPGAGGLCLLGLLGWWPMRCSGAEARR